MLHRNVDKQRIQQAVREAYMYRTKEQMKEETRICREANIMDIAQSLGIELRRRGSVFEDRGAKEVRIYPNTNSFYDFYQAEGGSPIDLVCKYRGCGVKDAVQYILDEIGYDRQMDYKKTESQTVEKEHVREYMEKTIHPDLEVPERGENNRRLFAYLNKTRGIDAAVIQQLLHEHRIYETKKHNVAFVAVDENGNPKHIFLRGTVTGKVWRGDTSGSDKAYGFNIESGSDELVVFEAPIDLLSYICLRKEDRHEDLLALGMCADIPIDTYLKTHPQIKTIHFMLDSDDPGMQAAHRMIEKYTEKGYRCTNHLMKELVNTGCKDVNEYLIKRKPEIKETSKKR